MPGGVPQRARTSSWCWGLVAFRGEANASLRASSSFVIVLPPSRVALVKMPRDSVVDGWLQVYLTLLAEVEGGWRYK